MRFLRSPCHSFLAWPLFFAPPFDAMAQTGQSQASSGRWEASIAAHGAIGDGATLATKAIQSAIDQVAATGGGTVVIPQGVFLSGAIFLKPGVNLHFEKDAVLKASTDMADFPAQRTRIEGHFEESFNPALINADGCNGLRLSGEGTLDGAGRPIWDLFWEKRKAVKDRQNFKNLSVPRARLCLIENSKDVVVQGITFKDSQFWNLHLYNCQDVLVENARFEVPDYYKQAPSSDAIDVDSCRNVTIRGCHFSVTDDCIALKGSKGPFAMEDKTSPPVEQIRITNCVFRRGHSMITCGSEATIVRDVIAENCEVTAAMPLLSLKLRPDTPQRYENILIRNIFVEDNGATLFAISKWTQYFDLKGQPEPNSVVRNVKLSDLKGSIGSLGVVQGNKGTEFGEITLENVDVKAKKAKLDVDEKIKTVVLKDVTVNGEPFTLK